MGINVVQQFIRTTLDGMLLPLQIGNLAAYITPPNPGDGTQAGAYVWGASGHETRKAVPRAQPNNLPSGAWKATNHSVDVWLIWIGSSEDPDVNQQFPVIIDAVMAQLRNVQLNDQQNMLTDPVTQAVSWLLNLGEDMSHEYGPVRALNDQRLLRFDARVTCSAEEWFQA